MDIVSTNIDAAPSFTVATNVLRIVAAFAGSEGATNAVHVGMGALGSPMARGAHESQRGCIDAWATNGHVAMVASLVPTDDSGDAPFLNFRPGDYVSLPAPFCAKLTKGRARFRMTREEGAAPEAPSTCTVEWLDADNLGASQRVQCMPARSAPNLGHILSRCDGRWLPGIVHEQWASSREASCNVFDTAYIARIAQAFADLAKVRGYRKAVDCQFTSAETGSAHLMHSRVARAFAVVMPLRFDYNAPTDFVVMGDYRGNAQRPE